MRILARLSGPRLTVLTSLVCTMSRTTLGLDKCTRLPSSSFRIALSPSPRSVGCIRLVRSSFGRRLIRSCRLSSVSLQLWIHYAQFELRRKDVEAAKKIMGVSIGMCPKEKLFNAYIDLRTKVSPPSTLLDVFRVTELTISSSQLYEFDDVRTIYMKYLEFDPSNTAAWVKWAQLEGGLGDLERARYLFDLGTTQELDMPEVLWKAWIDFEFEQGERERTRALYEALLSKTGHVKVCPVISLSLPFLHQSLTLLSLPSPRAQVWNAYALFEVQPMSITDEEGEEDGEEPGDPELARQVLQRGYTDLKDRGLKEEVRSHLSLQVDSLIELITVLSTSQRVVLLEAWKEFEKFHGTAEELAKVEAMMPRVVKKWRKLEDGSGALEECKSTDQSDIRHPSFAPS